MNVFIYISIIAACMGIVSSLLAFVSYRVTRLSTVHSESLARQAQMNDLLIKRLKQLKEKGE